MQGGWNRLGLDPLSSWQQQPGGPFPLPSLPPGPPQDLLVNTLGNPGSHRDLLESRVGPEPRVPATHRGSILCRDAQNRTVLGPPVLIGSQRPCAQWKMGNPGGAPAQAFSCAAEPLL